MRILIIDDEECIRDSIAIHLCEQGYDVKVSINPLWCSGTKMKSCQSEESCADVLIIDQWMPEMTGVEYLRNRHAWGCRSVGQYKALMSASLPGDLKKEALRLGCKLFEKPVLLHDIEEWLTGLVPSARTSIA